MKGWMKKGESWHKILKEENKNISRPRPKSKKNSKNENSFSRRRWKKQNRDKISEKKFMMASVFNNITN